MNETTEETLRRSLLDMKYARIIEIIAEREHIGRERAMEMFYTSPVLDLIENGISDLHCRSALYLAEEIIANAK